MRRINLQKYNPKHQSDNDPGTTATAAGSAAASAASAAIWDTSAVSSELNQARSKLNARGFVHSDLAEVMKAAEAHEGQGVQKILGGERWAGGSGPSEVHKKPAESCTACWQEGRDVCSERDGFDRS